MEKKKVIISVGAVLAGLAGFLVFSQMEQSIALSKSLHEIENIEDIGGLSKKDKALVASYIVRIKLGSIFSKEEPDMDITVEEAIEKQKVFLENQKKEKAEQAHLKKELEQKRKDFLAAVSKYITVTFLRKRFLDRDFDDKIELVLGFENKSERNIAGVKGVTEFNDMFGDTIKKVNLSYDEGIKAGEKKEWKGYLDYNQFQDEDIKLRSTEDKKIVFHFSVDTIIFENGEKLSVDE